MGLPAHLAGLMRPEAYPHGVERIELVETHISWVLLTGQYAYKLKRPVAYDFVDLRSAERRAFFCSEELRLNRRFAPELYLEVCDIREEDDQLHIGGNGRRIERCVRMRQFPREDELDRLLGAGAIDTVALEQFGHDLARIHERLPAAGAQDDWGYPHQVRRELLENIDQYERAADTAVLDVRSACGARLGELDGCIAARREHGRVRECHGDLHMRNIVRRGGRLLAFDCMEFNSAFRWIDVADEVAFLCADLHAHGCARHAHAFLSGYLTQSGDFQACRVLNLYRSHRALVRAKVAFLEASTATATEVVARARKEHDLMLAEARRKPEPGRSLMLITGLSGSGKTWLARRLAPDLGAIHLRSDIERKRLAGLRELESSGSGIVSGLYEHRMTHRVYEHLAQAAEDVLAGGYPVIVDATFSTRAERALFKELAERLAVRLQVVLCEAPESVLRSRISERQQRGDDASEAGLTVLDWQLRHREPIEAEESLEVIRVSTFQGDPLGTALRSMKS